MTFQTIHLPPHLAVEFARVKHQLPSLRDFLAKEIDDRIAVLDALDGDPDLETTGDDEPSIESPMGDETEGDDADDEPALGSPERTAAFCPRTIGAGGRDPSTSQERWAAGDSNDAEEDAGDDREEENEHGGDVQDEPHDREEDANEEDLGGEATLGWCENVGQLRLGPNTDDGDATALERYGAGFLRSGHDDDEDSHDREALNEDGSDDEVDLPVRSVRVPHSSSPEYILNVRGGCCAPAYPDGSKVLFDARARPAPGDFVAIHFTPDTAKQVGCDAWLKRLVFMSEPSRGNIEPCVCVEQLNPPKSYVIPWSSVLAVHRAVGLKPDDVRGVPMTAAARRKLKRTWIRGAQAKALKQCA